MKQKLKFVEFGSTSVNPWAVASVIEADTKVFIRMIDGHIHHIDKYVGNIIVNDKKSIVSALELAVNSEVDTDD